jgi:hypothetical protein
MEKIILIIITFSAHVIFVESDDIFNAVVSYSLWDYLELDQFYERMQSRRGNRPQKYFSERLKMSEVRVA